MTRRCVPSPEPFSEPSSGPERGRPAPTAADLDARIARARERLDGLRAGAGRALAAWEDRHDIALCHGSCAIEGNVLTPDEAASLLATQSAVPGRPLYDQMQILNEAAACILVHEHVACRGVLDEGFLRAVHERAVLNCEPRDSRHERQLRAGPETTGLLPAPGALPALLAGLARWLEDAGSTPAAAFEAHWRLVAMQAFAAANNRVARLAMTLLLRRGGYPPVVVEPEARAAYLDALRARRDGRAERLDVFLRTRLLRGLDGAIEAASRGRAV